MRAAFVKGAAAGRIQRAGQLAGDLDFYAALVAVNGRRSRQQGLRIRVQRTLEDMALGTHLDCAAQVHHHQVVGHVLHHRQVVRDKHVSGVELILQVHEQVQHLGLDGYVERRGWLIRHQDLGLQDHGPCNRNPLALATGEHVRIALRKFGAQADAVHGLNDLGGAFGGGESGVQQQRLGQLVDDFLARVQRRIRILEHHLYLAAHGFALGTGGGTEWLAVHDQRAGGGGFNQCQLSGQGAFAAAGFAHHRQGFAGL